MSRTIFHVDVNSAFLSWSALEQLKEKPGSVDLRTIPSAVGGDVQTRHGIITAKSIPAKAYHIQTGEPVVRALEKCPQLVLVRSNFKAYRRYSSQFILILREYTDQVEQASIDEAYMDVSGLVHNREEALALADQIKDTVKGRLGFTVNVGISENKFLAKMASDFEKPDRVHILYPEEIREKMWPLKVRDLFGCGAATAQQLNEMGFHTIGDLAACSEQMLKSILGEKRGEYIHKRVHGIDDSFVETVRQEAKSYSNETTTAEDINRENYDRVAIPIIRQLGTRLNHSTNDAKTICDTAFVLMKELTDRLFDEGEVLRLIGIGMSGLDHGEYRQMGMEDWMQENERNRLRSEKKKKMDEMVSKIRSQYGEGAVFKGRPC